jgi:hypothetical protein
MSYILSVYRAVQNYVHSDKLILLALPMLCLIADDLKREIERQFY